MPIPDGISTANVRCGTLTVAEDHRKPAGPSIELAVAVVKASPPSAADPVVFIGGGPGAAELDYYLASYAQAGALIPLLQDRDWVFFDQRGTGRSKPSLTCAERDDAFWRAGAQPSTPEQVADAVATAMSVCYDRYATEGVHLDAYRSAQAALDVPDLMTALGYTAWNLYGISYGTRVALTVLRDAPKGVRSVILDSNVPVEVSLGSTFASSAQRAFDQLFAGCAANAACNAAYPALDRTFYDLVDRLDASPITLSPVDSSTGQPFTVVLTGSGLALMIQQALYVTQAIPLLPELIAGLSKSDDSLALALLPSLKAAPSPAYGLEYATLCAESAPFDTPDQIAQNEQNVRAELRPLDLVLAEAQVCPILRVTPAGPIEHEPVRSDVPALILQGEYDPVTTPEFGRQIAANFPNSQYFEFPGLGHGIVRAQTAETDRPRCAVKLAGEFLTDSTSSVDGACAGALPEPEFSVP
jgi:pimeloyl-ACP methyl ester carboxylesterase